MNLKYIIILLLFSTAASFPNPEKIKIGIDEKLGNTIPLNQEFVDENGIRVELKDLLTRPTILAFVYYNCPGICSPLLLELSNVINKTDLILGVDYNVVVISMDELETPADAKIRKNTFFPELNRKAPPDSWKFLTGDSISIKKVSDECGFYFERQGKDFLHTGAFIFIDKNGKICRYLFPGFNERSGFGILPFDFKMAILETSEGKVNPTIGKVLQFCFKYDPQGKTYVLNITQIFGVVIILFAVIFLGYLKLKPKKNEFSKAR